MASNVHVNPLETPAVPPTIAQATVAVEHIVEARYVDPSQMYLRFADGLEGTWTFEQLDLDMSNMKSETIKVAGDEVEVRSSDDEDLHLDSSALRYRVDAKYAAEMEERINGLRMTRTELDEACRVSMLTRDPRWKDVGDEADLFGDHDG